VVVAPSGGKVHPTGKPYMLLAGGITTIPRLTAEERQFLFSVAHSFDQTTLRHVLSDVRQQVRTALAQRERPGDRYNRRASWAEMLELHG
jgi:putative DNA primase/helicase